MMMKGSKYTCLLLRSSQGKHVGSEAETKLRQVFAVREQIHTCCRGAPGLVLPVTRAIAWGDQANCKFRMSKV